jgi:hypothetical protein
VAAEFCTTLSMVFALLAPAARGGGGGGPRPRVIDSGLRINWRRIREGLLRSVVTFSATEFVTVPLRACSVIFNPYGIDTD